MALKTRIMIKAGGRGEKILYKINFKRGVTRPSERQPGVWWRCIRPSPLQRFSNLSNLLKLVQSLVRRHRQSDQY